MSIETKRRLQARFTLTHSYSLHTTNTHTHSSFFHIKLMSCQLNNTEISYILYASLAQHPHLPKEIIQREMNFVETVSTRANARRRNVKSGWLNERMRTATYMWAVDYWVFLGGILYGEKDDTGIFHRIRSCQWFLLLYSHNNYTIFIVSQ